MTLSATPKEGYQFKEWQVVSGGVTIADNKFVIGTENVEIKAIFEEIPASVYTVTVTTDGNGTATADPTSGEEGTEVTLSATPNEGYQFKEWQVVSGGVTIADNKFVIGTENVEIKAIFEKTVAGEPPVIIQPTEDLTVTAVVGTQQTLTVEAINADTYQWYINRNDGLGYVEIEGATGPSYTTSTLKLENDGFTYICVARNAYGEDTSPVFTLEVIKPISLPQTGDNSRLGLWMALWLVSSLGGIALIQCRKKSRME